MSDMPSTPPEKLAPNSPEAEEAVIGSVLINPESLYAVAPIVHTADFFIVRNAWVWEAILDTDKNGYAIDNLTVIETLRAAGRLDQIGGSAYITYLINNTPTHIHAETYANIVAIAALRRRILAAASDVAQASLEETSQIDDVINHVQTTVFHAVERRADRMTHPVGHYAREYYDQVQAIHERGDKLLGVPSGYHALDKLLSGFQRKTLTVLAARPSVGKTGLALHFAMNCARAEEPLPVAFVSLEMSGDLLVNRMIGSHKLIDTQKLQIGELTDQEWGRFTDGMAELDNWPIFIDVTPGLTLDSLRMKARLWKHKYGIRMLLVDYLQLMSVPEARSREQEVSAVAQGLKEIAMELDLPVVALAQLNREIEKRQDKIPLLSDLRESGAIEQAADVVMFLHRPDMYNATDRPGHTLVIVAKNRNGPTGGDTLMFKKEYTRFENMIHGTLDLRNLPGYGKDDHDDHAPRTD